MTAALGGLSEDRAKLRKPGRGKSRRGLGFDRNEVLRRHAVGRGERVGRRHLSGAAGDRDEFYRAMQREMKAVTTVRGATGPTP